MFVMEEGEVPRRGGAPRIADKVSMVRINHQLPLGNT